MFFNFPRLCGQVGCYYKTYYRNSYNIRAEQVKRTNRSSDMLSIVKEVHIMHAWAKDLIKPVVIV